MSGEGQIVNEESVKLRRLVDTNYKKSVGPQLIISSMTLAVELQ